jgi:membrane protease YdiL (CAAX protease family)
MTPKFRLLWLSIFLSFANEIVAFSPLNSHFKHASKVRVATSLSAQSHGRSHRVSAPLYYRDRDDVEKALTTTATKPTNTMRRQLQPQDEEKNQPGISMPLIRAIWYNQAAIFLFATAMTAVVALVAGGGVADFANLHWNGGSDFRSFLDLSVTPVRVLEGVLATIPMVTLVNTVEKSDRRDASHVNFSTTNMVISLFGRRRTADDPTATSSSLVMALSAAIALSTGLAEEMVFRGYIPTAIVGLTHSLPLALVGQAALFSLGHISPRSTTGENKVVGSLQFVNGLWYGLVYLVAGGDVLPCIIAHILYDMHVFCETWMTINRQMDYTKEAFQKKLDPSEELAIQKIQQKGGPSLNTETLDFARRFFYAFDYDHKGSLSLQDVQRAVSYAFLQDKTVPPPIKVEEMFDKVLETRQPAHSTYFPPDRMIVSEFLRVLLALKSQSWAA